MYKYGKHLQSFENQIETVWERQIGYWLAFMGFLSNKPYHPSKTPSHQIM